MILNDYASAILKKQKVETAPVVLRTSPGTAGLGQWAIPESIGRLEAYGANTVHWDDESEAGLLKAVAKHRPTILLTTYGAVTRAVLQAGKPELKAIVKSGTGIDTLDVAAAKEEGVRVVNLPEYGAPAVAECALTLLLTLTRRMGILGPAMQRDGWVDPDEAGARGVDLHGRKLGIIGLGHIGSQFACMALGLQMDVAAYDPALSPAKMAAMGVRAADLAAMVAHSDVLALFLPLDASTRNVLSEELIRTMKPSAIVLNAARGKLVDEAALADAIVNGRLAALGCDVFGQEPLGEDHPMRKLLGRPNVAFTPHIGSWTDESWANVEREVYDRCVEVLSGAPSLIRSGDPRLQGQKGCVYDVRMNRASLPAILQERQCKLLDDTAAVTKTTSTYQPPHVPDGMGSRLLTPYFGVCLEMSTPREFVAHAAALRRFVAHHGFVVLRNPGHAPISEDDLLELAAALGEVTTESDAFADAAAILEPLGSHPGLYAKSDQLTGNQVVETYMRALELGTFEAASSRRGKAAVVSAPEIVRNPHAALAYRAKPARFSLVGARELSKHGGERLTLWSTAAAFAALSPPMRAMVRSLRGQHATSVANPAVKVPMGPPATQVEMHAEHPAAMRVPESGAETLYVNGTYLKGFAGLSALESKHTRAMLVDHATQSTFRYIHTWEAGDVVIWDNWSTMHDAADGGGGLRHCQRATTVQAVN